jgi:L-seryl-tRNA(Ser) seleniumtransferase
VGTTNKTRGSDYGAAINAHTALILRVHPSNFRIEGFTERPSLTDLVALGRKFNIPVAEDLGSGHLDRVATRSGSGAERVPIRSRSGTEQVAVRSPPLGDEPAVVDTIRAGVDVCCFSGDKLLGGPQAGIIVGRTAVIERIRTHPLMRALRVDKMTYAALEATLTEYAAGRAATTVPVQRMLTMTADEIRARAETLTTALRALTGWHADTVSGMSAIGGGSAPGVELPTSLVAIATDALSPDALEARLRLMTPPIVGRIDGGRVLLDLRTVLADQDALIIRLLSGL